MFISNSNKYKSYLNFENYLNKDKYKLLKYVQNKKE